ncbi:MAG: hypothetical protein CMJ84_17800 [Planctomycetes bacterium]|nr:hypothetical protein [Planctomycetota bacterium]
MEERVWYESRKRTHREGDRMQLEVQGGGAAELRAWILSVGTVAAVPEPAARRKENSAEPSGVLERFES